MSDRIGTPMGQGQSVVTPLLKRISAGWVDQELQTVRKMAAAGATADEIGAACGKNAAWALRYIRRNRLVWNRMRGDVGRHLVQSAGAMAAHETRGHLRWVEEGLRLWNGGVRAKEIGAQLGVSPAAVVGYMARHNHKRPRVRMASRSGMLSLIIRLHVECVLSEGQVQEATGLDRSSIRRLAATPSAPTPQHGAVA